MYFYHTHCNITPRCYRYPTFWNFPLRRLAFSGKSNSNRLALDFMEKIQQIHGILGFFCGDKMDVFFYNCCYRNYSSYLIEIYECLLLTSLELWSLGSSFYDVSWNYFGSWEVNPGPLRVISTSSECCKFCKSQGRNSWVHPEQDHPTNCLGWKSLVILVGGHTISILYMYTVFCMKVDLI